MTSADDVFTLGNMDALTDLVADAWMAGADRDWNVRAGTLEWTCLETADHAVDTVLAPAFFLASRKRDGYPAGESFTVGPTATAAELVEALHTATRILAAVVIAAEPDVRSIIWLRPQPEVRPPADFVPRGGLELILHAHDVCTGLAVPFEPPADLCARLRDHTRSWPMWTYWSSDHPRTDDPWGDLLSASGRSRAAG